jgi:hypothetical protein
VTEVAGPTVTVLATAVVLTACTLLAVLLVLTKLGREGRARRRAALLAPLRPHLIAVAAGEALGDKAAEVRSSAAWAGGRACVASSRSGA